jgi:hypothetical protein
MRRIALVFGVVLTLARIGNGQVGVEKSLFGQGRTHASVTGGYASFNNKDYFVLGLGAGYNLLDGLEAGMGGEVWTGSKPNIYTVSPQLNYFLPLDFQWKPYLGGFYKKTFYQTDFKNLDSAGARAGLAFPLATHAYATAGIVYEKFLNCDSSIYTSCSQTYPEFGIALSY